MPMGMLYNRGVTTTTPRCTRASPHRHRTTTALSPHCHQVQNSRAGSNWVLSYLIFYRQNPKFIGRPQPWGSQKKVRDRLVSCLRCNLCVPIRKIRGETGLKPPRFHPLGSILGDITLNGFIARTLISPRCGATTLERHFRPQLTGVV